MPIYEVVLDGFDGSTDETDVLIKWVDAPALEDAERACENAGWKVETISKLEGRIIYESKCLIDIVALEQYYNQYEHCGVSWDDYWDSGCDDECPICGADVSPISSDYQY